MPVHRCKCLLYCLVCMETYTQLVGFHPLCQYQVLYLLLYHYDHLGWVYGCILSWNHHHCIWVYFLPKLPSMYYWVLFGKYCSLFSGSNIEICVHFGYGVDVLFSYIHGCIWHQYFPLSICAADSIIYLITILYDIAIQKKFFISFMCMAYLHSVLCCSLANHA